MIFVTIGSQAPFDRLIKTMDAIAPFLEDTKIIAQISKSSYEVKNMQTFEFLSPTDFKYYFNKAKLVVSHAGMGTIISALEIGKPILVMPRLVEYREHRNNHQLATARIFEKLKYIHVAYDERSLHDKLMEIFNDDLEPLHRISKIGAESLRNSISDFIRN